MSQNYNKNKNTYVVPKGQQSYEKKIEDEERREKYRKILEKRRAKSSAEDPKDIPNDAENGNGASENSKKE